MTIPPRDDAGVAARYYDGQTSRAHQVVLTVLGDEARLAGEVSRVCPLAALRLSERSRHAVRKVTFPDGAFLEIADKDAFERLLARTGQRDGWVVRLQQSWRGAALAAGGTVLALALTYLYLLPAAAGWIAVALPPQVERQLGDGVLAMFDGRIFAPSRLPAQRQRQLSEAFGRLGAPKQGAPAWHIVYRSSRIGPNAFALPSGDIVLTDEMVALLADDEAVMGVLAHELGHLHERHMTRRLIQGSAVAGATALLFGDVSSALSGVPALALDMKYSRDAEREADDYAVAMLRHNGIAPEHLARAFEKMEALDHDINPYLSSHPASAERVARIRGGSR